MTGSWGPCSRTCGTNGIQKRNVTCRRVDGEGRNRVVNDRLCLAERKPLFRQTCILAQCPSRWKAGPWSQVRVLLNELHSDLSSVKECVETWKAKTVTNGSNDI